MNFFAFLFKKRNMEGLSTIVCPSCKTFVSEDIENTARSLILVCQNCKVWFGGLICRNMGHDSNNLKTIEPGKNSYKFDCWYPNCPNNTTLNLCVVCSHYKNSKFRFCQTCEVSFNKHKKLHKLIQVEGVYFLTNDGQQTPICLGESNDNFYSLSESRRFNLLFSLVCGVVDIKTETLNKRIDVLEEQQTEILKKLDEIKNIVTWMPGLQAANETKKSFDSNLNKQEK